MRNWIYAATASLSLAAFGALMSAPASAMPIDHAGTVLPADIEQAQFFFGGRNFCWYDNGWNGPGYYWCGYAFRRGFGWGGGYGWHGWRGGRPGFGRPGGGRPGFGRPPGGGRPGMGRPGGGRPGGGRPGGGGGHHR